MTIAFTLLRLDRESLVEWSMLIPTTQHLLSGSHPSARHFKKPGLSRLLPYWPTRHAVLT